MSTISEQLKAWRAVRGLSQSQAAVELARVLGVRVPLATYLQWEHGRRTPRGLMARELERICRGAGCAAGGGSE
jgi:transcriptional regulator with XRE-family HTH domain